MFDLGYKQIVINSSSVVTTTDDGGNPATITGVTIEGFGTFDPLETGARLGTEYAGFKAASSPAVAGEYSVDISGLDLADGASYDIKVNFSRAGRPLSELFPSYGGEIKIIQYTVVDATDLSKSKVSVIDGFDDKIFTASVIPTGIKIIFNPGYEGIGIQKISGIESTSTTDEFKNLLFNVDVEPSEGVGLGKLIEAEVRNATFDNIDPYGIQFGGNSAVDVRGKYTTIMWYAKAAKPGMGGWEPHALRGYGDANTESLYEPVKFVAYVNEASASDVISAIETLI